MNLKDVQRVLKAKILVGEEFMDRPAETCCGSDLMSDVLAFTRTGFYQMQHPFVYRPYQYTGYPHGGHYRFMRHRYCARQAAFARFFKLCARGWHAGAFYRFNPV